MLEMVVDLPNLSSGTKGSNNDYNHSHLCPLQSHNQQCLKNFSSISLKLAWRSLLIPANWTLPAHGAGAPQLWGVGIQADPWAKVVDVLNVVEAVETNFALVVVLGPPTVVDVETVGGVDVAEFVLGRHCE
jgi:hypothetical protein